VSEDGGVFFEEGDLSAAIAELLPNWRIRRQQSPRFNSGTSCKTLLIASCFPAGPSFSPTIKTRSKTGRSRGLIFCWVFLPTGLADMATTLAAGWNELSMGSNRPLDRRVAPRTLSAERNAIGLT
jgi:hypothetical protein